LGWKYHNHVIFIYQKKHAKEILKKFHMKNCKFVASPLVANEKQCLEDDETKGDGLYKFDETKVVLKINYLIL